MFRVLSVPIIRSTIKTADAIIGTVHAVNYKRYARLYDTFIIYSMNCTYDCICSFNCTPDDGCRKHPKHVEYPCREE
jgi:hypothetical protein